MASSPELDPFEMWRQALSKLEGGVNSMAASPVNSTQFAQALQQFTGVQRGMEQIVEKALGRYYRRLNLASRQEIGAMADTLQRIEAKLDQLLTTQAPAPSGPRPARTRRPPIEADSPVGSQTGPAKTQPAAKRPRRRT